MKDLTIAQAQANVERRIKAEKRKGKRQRMPKANAMQGMVVAEARRLEETKAQHALNAALPHHELLREWATQLAHAAKATEKKLKRDAVAWTGPQREPAPMRNMAEVNRRVMELKRRVLMIERDAVELAMQVRRLLAANPTDLGDGKDA